MIDIVLLLLWGSCCSSFSFVCNDWYIIVCPFPLGHCVVHPSSIYNFWITLWYLQTFLTEGYQILNIKFAWWIYSYLCCGVHVARSLVLCVCFVDICLFFCSSLLGHCVVCSSFIYDFWITLRHLQTFLTEGYWIHRSYDE
jgi:hypothetical protein